MEEIFKQLDKNGPGPQVPGFGALLGIGFRV